jgi:glycine C-acetyltransferase
LLDVMCLQVDIINSTLGKALGGATGGYTTGRPDVVALLRQKSRPYLFSNTLAPSVAAASQVVFEMLESDTSLKEKLEANTRLFRNDMAAAGFSLGSGTHPIVVRIPPLVVCFSCSLVSLFVSCGILIIILYFIFYIIMATTEHLCQMPWFQCSKYSNADAMRRQNMAVVI